VKIYTIPSFELLLLFFEDSKNSKVFSTSYTEWACSGYMENITEVVYVRSNSQYVYKCEIYYNWKETKKETRMIKTVNKNTTFDALVGRSTP
jgi:hypothetical protein